VFLSLTFEAFLHESPTEIQTGIRLSK